MERILKDEVKIHYNFDSIFFVNNLQKQHLCVVYQQLISS